MEYKTEKTVTYTCTGSWNLEDNMEEKESMYKVEHIISELRILKENTPDDKRQTKETLNFAIAMLIEYKISLSEN